MAQEPGAQIFESRCATCHGGDAAGGDRAPSLLSYIRYHTDAEASDVIQNGRIPNGMPSFAFADSDLKAVTVYLRSLGGTNPAMATAGLTGQNRKAPPSAPPLTKRIRARSNSPAEQTWKAG
jgi:mono/diheme cytochrome c family protein